MTRFTLIAVMLLGVLSCDIHAQGFLNIRKKIVPLQTSKSEVEKIAVAVGNQGNEYKYETETENITVNFTGKCCDQNGWNVAPNLVLRYTSYPKVAVTKKAIEELLAAKPFSETTDDTLTRYVFDSANGIIYALPLDGPNVQFIGFSPITTDNDKRCNGFPRYDLYSDFLSPFQTGNVTDPANWDAYDFIYTTLRRVKEVRQDITVKGYIYIYCKRGSDRECGRLLKLVREVAKKELGAGIDRMTIQSGGYRDVIEFETFLVSQDSPPILPTPYFPS